MKTMGDMLLNPGSFSEIVMGNTALVRGMVEAGAGKDHTEQAMGDLL